MQPGPTLQQRRARETRDSIVDAASRVVARHGYGEATVEQIAAEAGASMGALYYHFPTKEQLFKCVLKEHVRSTFHAVAALPEPSSLRDAIANLASFWLDHLRDGAESGPLRMEVWAQAARQEWAHQEVHSSLVEFRSLIAGMLRAGQEMGVIRAGLETESAAFLIVSTLEGVALQYTIGQAAAELEALKGPLTELIERFISD
ncbi:MAG: TetR/AcrR family transcriptional regulator [Dehalococcoidia bacterium]